MYTSLKNLSTLYSINLILSPISQVTVFHFIFQTHMSLTVFWLKYTNSLPDKHCQLILEIVGHI